MPNNTLGTDPRRGSTGATREASVKMSKDKDGTFINSAGMKEKGGGAKAAQLAGGSGQAGRRGTEGLRHGPARRPAPLQ